MNKCKICLSLGLVMLLSLIIVYGAENNFLYSMKIINRGEAKYKAIAINKDVYTKLASQNAIDYLIYNQKGNKVPFFELEVKSVDKDMTREHTALPVNEFVKNDKYYMDFKVSGITENTDINATSIQIDRPNVNFAKEVAVFGSLDNTNWEEITRDHIYNVDEAYKTEISLPKTEKYIYYRFEFSNNLEKIRFDKLVLKYRQWNSQNLVFTETFTPQYEISQLPEEKETKITLKGVKNLPLESIVIDTDDIFNRSVMIGGRTQALYNYAFQNVEVKNTTFKLGGQQFNTDNLELVISNGDDRPVDIKGIELVYRKTYLVFASNDTDQYTLKFSDVDFNKKPSYDIVKYQDLILKEGYDLCDAGEIEMMSMSEQSSGKENNFLNGRFIFNVTITIVAIVLIWILFIAVKRKSQSN